MEIKENPRSEKERKSKLSPGGRICLAFGILLYLANFFWFFLLYDVIFSNDWAGFGALLICLQISLAFLILGVFLFFALRETKYRVKFRTLFLTVLLVPLLSGAFHNGLFHKNEGPLHSWVDRGGVFYFLRIGDFDFDGENDRQHRERTTERTENKWATYLEEAGIHQIKGTVTGTGLPMLGDLSLWEKNRELRLHLNLDTEYRRICYTFHFFQPEDAERFQLEVKGQNRGGECVPVPYTLNYQLIPNDDHTVTLVLDAKDCRLIQDHALYSEDMGHTVDPTLIFSYSIL